MKRLLSIVIVVALAVTIFFLGWVQLYIPPRNVAFAESKTSGFNSQPLYSNTFAWMWENLIPNNLHLQFYEDKIYFANIQHKGELPQAKLLEEFLNEKTSFNFSIDYTLYLRVDFISLGKFLSEQNVLPPDLSQFKEMHESQTVSLIMELLQEKIQSPEFLLDYAINAQWMKNYILEKAPKMSGFWTLENLTIQNWILPDINLYQRTQKAYGQFLDQLVTRKLVDATLQGELESREKLKIHWLEEYGKVLNMYPLLIDLIKANPDHLGIQSLLPSIER